jgi:glycine oxidase
MLAVDDPQNPPALMPLARLSRQLYPAWLRQIEQLTGLSVPLRTQWTLQHVSPESAAPADSVLATPAQIAALAPGLRAEGLAFRLLEEASLDPRDLCAALPAAFAAAGGTLLEHTEVLGVESASDGVLVQTSRSTVAAAGFVNCRGAWSGVRPGVQLGVQPGDAAPVAPVTPIKGHMANLRCAPGRLLAVVRTPEIYLIPRGNGRVTVGSTLEHAGFDTRVDAATIAGLIAAAQALLPELEAPEPSESWAGLRPGTPDGLPILGRVRKDSACWLATGHFRDGILLAPATAHVMAQAILGQPTAVALNPFRPDRF